MQKRLGALLMLPTSVCDHWTPGCSIAPLPQGFNYQNCQLKLNPKDKHAPTERLVMMGEPTCLVLIQADFSDMSHITGSLVLKVNFRSLVSCEVHKSDGNRLNVEVFESALCYKSSLPSPDTEDTTPDAPFYDPGSSIGSLKNPGSSLTLALFFEDKQKATQTRQFIEF
jgi:hypothetical protein